VPTFDKIQESKCETAMPLREMKLVLLIRKYALPCFSQDQASTLGSFA